MPNETGVWEAPAVQWFLPEIADTNGAFELIDSPKSGDYGRQPRPAASSCSS